MTRLALSYDELAEALGVTRRHIDNLVRRGEIKAIRLGGRRLVPMQEVERILELDGAA
jgi:excisionase family DNA binding protein